jgi:hypothetical protein
MAMATDAWDALMQESMQQELLRIVAKAEIEKSCDSWIVKQKQV